MDVTQAFAATFVDELAAQGVEYACVSPGSRSGPFFGVGLAKATGRPVVLLSTSGTAAAEFHAAVVEASYSRTPLIVITADRPPELQGVGANQSIDQQRLYGTFGSRVFDPGRLCPLHTAGRLWGRRAASAVAE